MKSIMTLSAITVLAALALVGCNQNTSSSSTDTSATNSSVGGAGNANTNMPPTNSLPEVHTNMASTNQ
jgi:uncharacterized lipoprotein NlpE involved in copper resistance